MVAKLTACIPAEQAKNFAKSLDLNGNDIPDFPYIQLSELCQVWITKKHHECTPEALVEALICTEGLGKYASGIGGNFSIIARLTSLSVLGICIYVHNVPHAEHVKIALLVICYSCNTRKIKPSTETS